VVPVDADDERVHARWPMFHSPPPRIDPFPYRSRPLAVRQRPDPFPARSPSFPEYAVDPFPLRSPRSGARAAVRDPFPARSPSLPEYVNDPFPLRSPDPGAVPVAPQYSPDAEYAAPLEEPPRREKRDPFAMGRLNPAGPRFVSGNPMVTRLAGDRWSSANAVRAARNLLGF
jgi:hypothetical protein